MNNKISSIYDYFSRGMFRDIFVRIKRIRDFDTDTYTVTKADRLRYQKGLDGLIDRYLKSLKKGIAFKFSDLYHTFPLVFEKFPQRTIGPAKRSTRPNRICIPGVKQLFVGSEGRFYPCYNFAHQGYDIGNYRIGLEIQKIRKLIQTFAGYCDEMCQNCWAFRLCAHCFMHTLENGQMSKKRKMEHCIRERERIAKDLGRFVHIWEQETKYVDHDDLSLHAIVRCHQQETTSRKRVLKSNRIVIEDLSDEEHLRDIIESEVGPGFLAKDHGP
jgi:radical SAM protein with 4Fe4S-binding SPASM domain